MAALGSYAIKSIELQRYLLCNEDATLQFSGEDSTVANASFDLEAGGSEKVNIKSSNGLYWRRVDQNSYRIVSLAVEPNEDQSSWSSTLFKIVKDEKNKDRILHVQLGHYIEPNPVDSARVYALQKDPSDNQIVQFEKK
ncbi:hypothetical protein CerSpe_195060 [Prunus speciosa]